MAKTVKFNLICDGCPVRTIDDLRNNFSIEDVLAYYKNRLLHRWLKVRGYDDELSAVEDIESEDDMEIIKELIRIFDVESDKTKVEESIYILRYLHEKQELYSIYNESRIKVDSIIKDYHKGYIQLIKKILNNSTDIAIIRAAVSEMINNYEWLLRISHRELFYKFLHNAPMALFVMLSHDETRKLYLPQVVSFVDEKGEDIYESDIYKKYDDKETEKRMFDKREMYERICALIPYAENILGDALVSFAGLTDGYWKDLETKDHKYMIIDMKSGNYVRSAGKTGEEFGYYDIQNKFIIIEGIDYKSNNSSHKLLYMEV